MIWSFVDVSMNKLDEQAKIDCDIILSSMH